MTAKANRIVAALGIALALASGCVTRQGASSLPSRMFPEVKVPAMYNDPDDVTDYVLAHFWDAFLTPSEQYLCDSTHIGGVQRKLFASELASYLSILENSPLDKALRSISDFFDKLEAYQQADTSSNVFAKTVEAVDYYLYDPNSEIRSEELYLPFVSKLAVSPLVADDMKPSYAHAAAMCGINRIGTPAADFTFIDNSGRPRTLYGEKCEYTVVLFVNPGCHACEDAVSYFNSPEMVDKVASGRVKILGIYIDEEIDKWKEESSGLPQHWICGYDPAYIIRSDLIYSIRAIPSIYLLDRDKNVLLKDALPQTVAGYVLSRN